MSNGFPVCHCHRWSTFCDRVMDAVLQQVPMMT